MKGLAVTALILVLIWAVLRFWSDYTESGRIDTCLDRGGAWNYEQSKCEGAGASP